jgi:hypothetical protein
MPSRRSADFAIAEISLMQAGDVPSNANITCKRIITRLKYFGTIDEEVKNRSIIMGCQDVEKNWIVSNAPTVSLASIRILISFTAIKDNPV